MKFKIVRFYPTSLLDNVNTSKLLVPSQIFYEITRLLLRFTIFFLIYIIGGDVNASERKGLCFVAQGQQSFQSHIVNFSASSAVLSQQVNKCLIRFKIYKVFEVIKLYICVNNVSNVTLEK